MILLIENEQDTEQVSKAEDEQAIEELAAKIFVEALFLRDLDRFFNKVLRYVDINLLPKTVQAVTRASSTNSLVQAFEQDLDNLLTTNYRRGTHKAIEFFQKDEYVNQLFSKPEIRRIIDETMASMDHYIVTRETFVSPEILATTEKNFEQATKFVDDILDEAQRVVTLEERNSLIMDNLTQRVENRKPGIAETETQNIYQATKQEMGVYVSEKAARVGQSVDKRWIATLDQKTRPEHVKAHGQKVPQNSLFTVWGEHLMYPGDTGHGASLKNVIRCRCESIMTVTKGV
jgi:polyhydroxyalkanoate synthesis regulator phasin